MIPTMLFVAVAWGEEPFTDDVDAPEKTPEPAPVATPVTSATPLMNLLEGTWYVTSMAAGKEAVVWTCGGHPDSFEFGEGQLMIGVGAQNYGGKVTPTVTGETLILKTTMEACRSTKNVTVKWADSGHKILDVTRCVGTPARVRAVRDIASGIPVLRQCCDPAGKSLKYVLTDEPCPAGATAQKPIPLAR
jgi:hypothetical protein